MPQWKVDIAPQLLEQSNDSNLNAHHWAVLGKFERDKEGRSFWLVSVKRQFQYDSSSHNPWQEIKASEISSTAVYSGSPGESSLLTEREIGFVKHNTDVVLTGRVRTPFGSQVTQYQCQFVVEGHFSKTLKIVGERKWVTDLGGITISHPLAFNECPMDYGLAMGGDERNKIGVGIDTDDRKMTESVVPRIFYPNQDWSLNHKGIKTAGFGPISPFFQGRAQYAGTYDEEWQEERHPLLPSDFDHRFYQSAPSDQQCKGHLSGNELVRLVGFASEGELQFVVPSVRLQSNIQTTDLTTSLSMFINDVNFDMNKKQVSIVYQGQIQLDGKEHTLKDTMITVV
ncbi:DUF2169 domain-containing protein [Vibrio sp.]|nr:DUF2169 domain-containing protein [Vibrio sp.]